MADLPGTLEKWWKAIAAGTAAITAAIALFMGAFKSVNDLTNKSELGAAIESHNASPEPHPALQKTIRALNEIDQSTESKLNRCLGTTRELGTYVVRAEAFNRESNPNHKLPASQFYVRAYERLVQRGYTVEDAITEALDLPWPNRPQK